MFRLEKNSPFGNYKALMDLFLSKVLIMMFIKRVVRRYQTIKPVWLELRYWKVAWFWRNLVAPSYRKSCLYFESSLQSAAASGALLVKTLEQTVTESCWCEAKNGEWQVLDSALNLALISSYIQKSRFTTTNNGFRGRFDQAEQTRQEAVS